MKKKLYLSGPMSGLPGYNAKSFEYAEETLVERGFEVINPVKFPEPVVPPHPTDAETWAAYLARDLVYLMNERPGYMVLLPGAENSKGSMLEAAFARSIGLAVTTLGDVLLNGEPREKPYAFPWPRKKEES